MGRRIFAAKKSSNEESLKKLVDNLQERVEDMIANLYHNDNDYYISSGFEHKSFDSKLKTQFYKFFPNDSLIMVSSSYLKGDQNTDRFVYVEIFLEGEKLFYRTNSKFVNTIINYLKSKGLTIHSDSLLTEGGIKHLH